MLRSTICLVLALVVLQFDGSARSAASTILSEAKHGSISQQTAPVSATEAPWDWPVADPHPIIRPYIAPETPYSAGHRGIDIGLSGGNEVRAPLNGIVHFVGIVVDRPVLSLRHPDGFITSFEPVTSTLSRGDAVTRGQVVGEVQAGHCVQPCLHFGVRLDDNYVSPLNYLGGIPRAILLPTRNR
ncbi:MAG: M23 family metallopeptidase [Rhodoglobus sp.]